jgi:hypothetical protein
MDTNLKNINFNKYKTLEEVFNEINIQETKFNNDYGGYTIGMRNMLKKIIEEKNELKRLLNQGERKEGESSLYKDYFSKILKVNFNKDDNNKKEKGKESEK